MATLAEDATGSGEAQEKHSVMYDPCLKLEACFVDSKITSFDAFKEAGEAYVKALASVGTAMSFVVGDFKGNLKKVKDSFKEENDVEKGLKAEIASGLHKNVGKDSVKLKDPSAAIALLWVCRHMEFISKMFELVCADEKCTTSTASSKAYDVVLKAYHGWVASTGFSAARRGLPYRKDLFKSLFPTEKDETVRNAVVTKDLKRLIDIFVKIHKFIFKLIQDNGVEDKHKV